MKTSVEMGARIAYERGRARRALVAALPVVALAAIASRIEHRLALATVVGVAMYALVAIFFWRGRGLARGVLPGIFAGVLPLAAMQAARFYGHACAGAMCLSVCVPTATIGGAAAGLLVGRFARISSDVRSTWCSATLFAALTGSFACACIGIAGITALVVGLAAGSLPFVIRPAPARGSK